MLYIIIILTVFVVTLLFFMTLLFVATLIQEPTKWSVGQVIQTPDSAFENLPDYNFKAHYINCLGYRVHFLDEGPRDGEIILLMHGQPSWSYLYRHMIPLLTAAGYRIIAPDNIGFGKSDKPVEQNAHNYQMHIDVMSNLVAQLKLDNVTLFAQDWGGLIGLRVVAKCQNQFARIMLSNTTLPAAKGLRAYLGYSIFKLSVWREGQVEQLTAQEGAFKFTSWVAYAKTTSHFEFPLLFQRATTRVMSKEELQGYAAPFPNNDYLAGVRKFPAMVASQLRQNRTVMDGFYKQWNKPFLTAYGRDDLLMAGRDKVWQKIVPGAQNQPHTIIDGGAHFIQEDQPEKLVELLSNFIDDNPIKDKEQPIKA